MCALAAYKPTFGKDQIVSATFVCKKFSEIRKRAKDAPLFISDRNEIDTVILDYQTYENMYAELEYLRERQFYVRAAKRLAEGDVDPRREPIDLEDALGKKGFAEYSSIDPEAISDEDLFE